MKSFFKQFAKYGGVAAGSAASDWAVFAALELSGIHYFTAFLIARLVGGVFSFFANKFYSFSKGETKKLGREARRFLLLYVFSYILSGALVVFFAEKCAISPYWSKLAADTSCLVINFFAMRLYVFHERTGLMCFCMRLCGWPHKPSGGDAVAGENIDELTTS